MAKDNRAMDRFGAWTSPDEEALINAIAGLHPALAAMLAEHEDYYEAILSTLFLADVARWLDEQFLGGKESLVAELLALFEDRYKNGDRHVRELIAGFVEDMLPNVGVRNLLGPLLLALYQTVNG